MVVSSRRARVGSSSSPGAASGGSLLRREAPPRPALSRREDIRRRVEVACRAVRLRVAPVATRTRLSVLSLAERARRVALREASLGSWTSGLPRRARRRALALELDERPVCRRGGMHVLDDSAKSKPCALGDCDASAGLAFASGVVSDGCARQAGDTPRAVPARERVLAEERGVARWMGTRPCLGGGTVRGGTERGGVDLHVGVRLEIVPKRESARLTERNALPNELGDLANEVRWRRNEAGRGARRRRLRAAAHRALRGVASSGPPAVGLVFRLGNACRRATCEKKKSAKRRAKRTRVHGAVESRGRAVALPRFPQLFDRERGPNWHRLRQTPIATSTLRCAAARPVNRGRYGARRTTLPVVLPLALRSIAT